MKEQKSVLVCGAAGGPMGSTGHHVGRMLAGKGIRVRALVYREDDRSEKLRQSGMEVVQGDLLDYRSVRSAMEGVYRAYFAYPVQDGLLEASTNFAVAAKQFQVELVVNLSQYLRGDGNHPTPHQKRHWLSEQIFNMADIGAVHLDAVVFFENFRALTQPSLASENAFYLPWGPEQTKFTMIAAEDIAAVATALLTGPLQPNATVFPLIGDVVTIRDIISRLAEISGKPVQYHNIPDERWAEIIRKYGVNETAVEHLGHLWRFLRSVPRVIQDNYAVSPSIERLTGVKPKSMSEYLMEQKQSFFD